jgi:hypothetical protein
MPMTARRLGFICLIVALLAAAASPFVLTKFPTVTTAPPATLSNGVWSVSGTTPVGIGKDAPKARIRRWDGAADVSYGR